MIADATKAQKTLSRTRIPSTVSREPLNDNEALKDLPTQSAGEGSSGSPTSFVQGHGASDLRSGADTFEPAADSFVACLGRSQPTQISFLSNSPLQGSTAINTTAIEPTPWQDDLIPAIDDQVRKEPSAICKLLIVGQDIATFSCNIFDFDDNFELNGYVVAPDGFIHSFEAVQPQDIAVEATNTLQTLEKRSASAKAQWDRSQDATGWVFSNPSIDKYDLFLLNSFLTLFMKNVAPTFVSFHDFCVEDNTSASKLLAMAAMGGLYCGIPGSLNVSSALHSDARRLLLAKVCSDTPSIEDGDVTALSVIYYEQSVAGAED